MLVMILVFGITIIGCNSEDKKIVSSEFFGKWEIDSILYKGTTYILPSVIIGGQMNSGGMR
jgi:uncharacterized secreted protein with C-terminal beta-propeller domain